MTVAEVLAAHRRWLEAPPSDDDPLGIRAGHEIPLEGNWLNVMSPIGHALQLAQLEATLELITLLKSLNGPKS